MSNIRRQIFEVSDVILGGQYPIFMDYRRESFGVGIFIDIVSGTANYSVEFTTDDVSGITYNNDSADPSTFRWHEITEFASPQTTSKYALFNVPVAAIRLNLTSLTGEVRMTAIQGRSS